MVSGLDHILNRMKGVLLIFLSCQAHKSYVNLFFRCNGRISEVPQQNINRCYVAR